MTDLQPVVDEIYEALKPRFGEGKVADYIPQLAHVDPKKFGMAVVDVEGRVFRAGESEEPFSIQSISKVFTLTLALGKHGESIWNRVGREPSGSSFNSIVQLEHEGGKPRNPFINAGAIAVSDLILAGHTPREAIGEIVRFVRFLADDETIAIDPAVARSEQATGFRNFALANFMRSFGVIDYPVEHVLGVYFHQCAIAMTCTQLARSGLFLAAAGSNPITGHLVVSKQRARRINALMLTCGHYDGSGGKASVAVWAPGLNENGNSLVGSLALEMLANRTGWSVFGQ